MVRLNVIIALAAVSGIAWAQDRDSKDRRAERPTACEIRAYFLDRDSKPYDTKDVSAAVVFENRDGKMQKYPMTLVHPVKASEHNPACSFYSIEGTDYRFGVVATCSTASVPGGNTHYDKHFIRPFPVVIEPDEKRTTGSREVPLTDCAYFKTYLNKDDLEAIDSANYTDVSVLFTVHNKETKTKCLSWVHGSPVGGTCCRRSADLKTLETQVSANEMDQAKVTMARIRDHVAALPASSAAEKDREECSSCCKDLDKAINAGDRDKALKEIHRLEVKCDACDSTSGPDGKPDHKK